MKDKIRIFVLERHKLLKEAEKIFQKAQEKWREYRKLCQERAEKIRQADLVENQTYVELGLDPISTEEKDGKDKGTD